VVYTTYIARSNKHFVTYVTINSNVNNNTLIKYVVYGILIVQYTVNIIIV